MVFVPSMFPVNVSPIDRPGKCSANEGNKSFVEERVNAKFSVVSLPSVRGLVKPAPYPKTFSTITTALQGTLEQGESFGADVDIG